MLRVAECRGEGVKRDATKHGVGVTACPVMGTVESPHELVREGRNGQSWKLRIRRTSLGGVINGCHEIAG